MKKISYWAKNHKNASRLMIISGFIVLNVIGFFIGILFDGLGVTFPYAFLLLSILLFFAGIAWYPLKKEKGNKIPARFFYFRQKCCDVVLTCTALLLCIYFGNQDIIPFSFLVKPVSSANYYSLPADTTAKTYKSIEEFSKMMKDENGNKLRWKERKKLLKTQVKHIKAAKNLSDSGKVILIVLSVLVAVFLIYLLAALSCELSCSGSDAAAILVGVGGTVGVVFLTLIVIRAIQRNSKKEKDTEKNKTPATLSQ